MSGFEDFPSDGSTGHDFLAALNLQENIPDPCIMVIFGASGDLTKRLLIPSLFNLYCDDLLPDSFAILGMAMDDFDTESFRARMSSDVQKYSRRNQFDGMKWVSFCERIHYLKGRFDNTVVFRELKSFLRALDDRYGTGGNMIFYMATPPPYSGWSHPACGPPG